MILAVGGSLTRDGQTDWYGVVFVVLVIVVAGATSFFVYGRKNGWAAAARAHVTWFVILGCMAAASLIVWVATAWRG
ncbi:hypothetical protein KPL74_11455 [Bacillus sp. NP157]|nr:hypothetical protein KPL74_11455 [Bacillus sp. NP157]